MPTLAAVILAAGESTRMRSKTVKVLHPIAGAPIIRYVIAATAACESTRLVLVVGRDGEKVKDAIGDAVIFVEQRERLGTGHALLQARPAVEGHADTVLCLYGDMPLIRPETVQSTIRRVP